MNTPSPSPEASLNCPVCCRKDSAPIRPIFDDRYGQPDLFMLMRCNGCGHHMTSPRLRESDLGALYSTYYPRKQVVAADIREEANRAPGRSAALRRWWNGTDNQAQYSVRPGELMLDIGCGSGLSLMEARKLEADVRGVEADPNVRRIALELDISIHIGSVYDDPFPSEKFDLIALNQVIEHIPDPDLMLQQLRSRLRPGGRITLVFPNVESIWCRLSGAHWINWHVPYHLHHFTRAGFASMAQRCGFRVRKVRTITPNLWTILQLRANRYDAERGQASPIWGRAVPETAGAPSAPPRKRSLARRILRRAVLIGSALPLALLNRTMDAFGLGDSILVEIVPVTQE